MWLQGNDKYTDLWKIYKISSKKRITLNTSCNYTQCGIIKMSEDFSGHTIVSFKTFAASKYTGFILLQCPHPWTKTRQNKKYSKFISNSRKAQNLNDLILTNIILRVLRKSKLRCKLTNERHKITYMVHKTSPTYQICLLQNHQNLPKLGIAHVQSACSNLGREGELRLVD